MHYTMFIGSLSGGGAERVISNLSNYLHDAGNDVTILTMSDEKPAYNLKSEIKLHPLYSSDESNNFIKKNLKRIYRLKKYIKSAKTSAYIVMLPITIILLLMFRFSIKVPIIISERGDPKTRYDNSKFHYVLMRFLYPLADNFVFQTQDSKDYYRPYINDRGVVIPNAINEDFIRPKYTGIKKKKIISSGRLNKQKNFEMLIRAFADIITEYPDFELEILGEGEMRSSLEKLITELSLNNKVKLPGYIDNVIDHMEESSLFVLPSDYEGMPNVLMEAMALGLPSIATDCPIGGPRFLIDNNENGILIEVGNKEELSKELLRLLNDEYLSEYIGNNARKVVGKLSPNIIYEKWLKTIEFTSREAK